MYFSPMPDSNISSLSFLVPALFFSAETIQIHKESHQHSVESYMFQQIKQGDLTITDIA